MVESLKYIDAGGKCRTVNLFTFDPMQQMNGLVGTAIFKPVLTYIFSLSRLPVLLKFAMSSAMRAINPAITMNIEFRP